MNRNMFTLTAEELGSPHYLPKTISNIKLRAVKSRKRDTGMPTVNPECVFLLP
jgi:hypothetical protein